MQLGVGYEVDIRQITSEVVAFAEVHIEQTGHGKEAIGQRAGEMVVVQVESVQGGHLGDLSRNSAGEIVVIDIQVAKTLQVLNTVGDFELQGVVGQI